jgi:hypothetical protein
MNLINFDTWDIYEGSSEGSGRSEKIWLASPQTGLVGVFKYDELSSQVRHFV